MTETAPSPDRYDEPTLYEIRIKGHLDDRWADTFDGLTLTREDDGVTILAGTIADQAALHGVLRAIRNLGVPLLSVTPVQSESAEGADGRPQVASHHPSEEAHP